MTILYASDWARHPTAIVDLQTKNQSFLRLARVYKSMGVANHAFLLALIQPELQGIDPHDPSLPEEIKLKIGYECRINIWYYLREVVRLPPSAGPNPIPFKANRANIAMVWSFFNHIDIWLIQPRQTGKSRSTDCLSIWIIYIGALNSRMIMITKDDQLRRGNIEKLKEIRNLLPPYLVVLRKDDADNQQELTCKYLSNRFTTAVGQSSEAAADNTGRGLTAPILHFDEPPFTDYIGTTLPVALSSASAARDEAALHDRPYGNIFTTTAARRDSRDGRYVYNLLMEAAPWTEVFLDAQDRKSLVEMVITNCVGRRDPDDDTPLVPAINGTFSHRQVGFDDIWLKRKIAESRSRGEVAERDYLNVWTAGTMSSPLSTEVLDAVVKSERDPAHTQITQQRYLLRWYIPENEIASKMSQGSYVMGLDTSDASGRDSVAMVILDVVDGTVVAGGQYNETNLIRLAYYVAELLIKYPTITLIPERRSTGTMITDAIILALIAAGNDPFRRIYNKFVEEANTNTTAVTELKRPIAMRDERYYEQYKTVFGMATSAESRALLFGNVLQQAASTTASVVHDKALSSELRQLVEKNGRIDHKSSGHDDMVVAWLLCHWLLTHAHNLELYGIDPMRVLRHVGEDGSVVTESQIRQREEQKRIMDEVEGLVRRLADESDEFVAAGLESRLGVLSERIRTEELTTGVSIAGMIAQARELRQRKRNQTRRGVKPRSIW